MATVPTKAPEWRNGYPTTDRKPMPETDWHRDLMLALIVTLQRYFAAQPRVYVSGNLLIFYEPGNRRRHVSPDVFMVRGVEKRQRPNYLVWEEGRGPEVAIELTSSTTRREDLTTKFRLYQDVLKVREYFLFDPLGDHLDPPLRGHRLRAGVYQTIRPVEGRFPSQVLGLHLERVGRDLRLYDPVTRQWLPTEGELVSAGETAVRLAHEARRVAEARADRAEAEIERLQRQIEELRRAAER